MCPVTENTEKMKLESKTDGDLKYQHVYIFIEYEWFVSRNIHHFITQL
jgi:hypothetical protein